MMLLCGAEGKFGIRRLIMAKWLTISRNENVSARVTRDGVIGIDYD
jgi:hypothetical protein